MQTIATAPIIVIVALIAIGIFTAIVKATLRLIGCALLVLVVLGAAAYFGSGMMH